IAGSSSSSTITPLLTPSKGDVLIDYRIGIPAMQDVVKKAFGVLGLEARHAIDAISADGSWVPIAQLLGEGGMLSVVSGANAYQEEEIPRGVRVVYTFVGAVHEGAYRS
ncbi:hypothetical protein IFR05_017619, partial [Cadophora sp. M221]